MKGAKERVCKRGNGHLCRGPLRGQGWVSCQLSIRFDHREISGSHEKSGFCVERGVGVRGSELNGEGGKRVESGGCLLFQAA